MKYKRFVDAAGGWDAFQGLLSTLDRIAHKHDVSVSNVASRWVLDHPAVASAIIGARLGESEHRADNLKVFDLNLDGEDRSALAAATRTLAPIQGDCGDEYRKPPFLTASGDLSHHLDALPPVFPVSASPSRPKRLHALGGSIWENKAGFSRAIRVGDRILISGTTATDPHGNPVCPGDAEGQTIYILDKIIAAISSLGGKSEDIVRTRIYLSDADIWEPVSAVHARYFGAVLPANTLVAVSGLIGPYAVEIEAEAIVDHAG